MAAALAAVVLAGDLSLLVVSWKHRSVLPGVVATVGIPLAVYAIASGPRRGVPVIAAIMLFVGTALYVLGNALQRLLDEQE